MSQTAVLQIEHLAVTGFGCFEEQSWSFGHMTTITGHNYQGKSTIADAIAYALTGAPFFGGRDIDRLLREGAPFLRVELIVRMDDGQRHTIRRGWQNRKSFLSLDGTTMTQERFAERFGSRDLILSLLNPLYFTEALGKDGKALLEQYLPPVSHEEVMAKLSEHMREILGEDRLEMPEVYLKNRREELKELQKDRLVIDGQMQQTDCQREHLQKELTEKRALLEHTSAALSVLDSKRQTQDTAALEAEIGALGAQYEALQTGEAQDRTAALKDALRAVQNRQYIFPGAEQLQQMQSKLQMLYGRYNDETARLNSLQQQGVCPTCLRRIDSAGLPEIQATLAQRLQQIKHDGIALRQQSEALAVQQAQGAQQFETQKAADAARLEQELQAAQNGGAAQQQVQIKARIKALSAQLAFGGLDETQTAQYQTLSREKDKLESEIEQIEKMLAALPKGQAEYLSELDESIKLVNEKIAAAKAYQSERAALLFAPVQMCKAALKLCEPMKESGELRDVFKLTYGGRDYVRLSLSERVRCGLEVAELLSRLSDKSYPLFVDNSESICDLGAAQHRGQLILARVVPRQTLQIKTVETQQQKAG